MSRKTLEGTRVNDRDVALSLSPSVFLFLSLESMKWKCFRILNRQEPVRRY